MGRPVTGGLRIKTSSVVKLGMMLTAEIELAMVLSTTNVGIRPPGLLDVAMRHSVFPPESSLILSTLTYRPLTPFSSSFASSGSLDRSTGMETNILFKSGMRNSESIKAM